MKKRFMRKKPQKCYGFTVCKDNRKEVLRISLLRTTFSHEDPLPNVFIGTCRLSSCWTISLYWMKVNCKRKYNKIFFCLVEKGHSVLPVILENILHEHSPKLESRERLLCALSITNHEFLKGWCLIFARALVISNVINWSIFFFCLIYYK